MNIYKEAKAGSLQSNDCLVKIFPKDSLEINVESILGEEFVEDIKNTVLKTLKKLDVNKARIEVEDKGAIDITIMYRVEKAVERAEKSL